MKILAFETSCDETGIALVDGEKTGGGFVFRVQKNALLSQATLHAPYGGVFPNLAKREHQKNLPILYEKFKNENADAIAVTHGPGLEVTLWQGIEFAKRVSRERGVPLIPVNHMEAHLLSSLAQQKKTGNEIEHVKLPVLALLISGGHTEFVLMRDWFQYEVIGQTLDDAVGECFDKVARLLGLPYPGGPEISRIAEIARQKKFPKTTSLPRPMLRSGNLHLSFSGLKTAALYALRDKQLNDDERAAFAAEFEETVADVFVAKTRTALEDTGAATFVIGGGVAANRYLRQRLEALVREEFSQVEFRLPDPSITGDNAVMIAECALARALSGLQDAIEPEKLSANGNLPLA